MAKSSRPTIEELEGKHFDVAVSGVWYGENYGSVLTYYALQKVIKDLGYSVLMVDKIGAAPGDPELDPGIHSRVFAREHGYATSPALAIKDMPRLNAYCDAFIMGCDQVWNFNIAKHCGKSFYFDYTDDDKKRLSCASSFGHATSHTPIEELSDVTRLLHRFDAISVREADAVDVLKNEFGVEGTQVADPVYLLDADEYRSLSCEPASLPRGAYLLAYILDPKPGMKRYLEWQANKLGLQLVVLLDGRGNFEANKKKLGIEEAFRCGSAPEWLWYFENADFVVTDSFHGASFALILEKQFYVLGNRQRGMSRFDSLVDTFKVRPCLAMDVRGLRAKGEQGIKVDYELVRSIKAMEKRRSLAWLDRALSAEKASSRSISVVPKKECCGCAACMNACPKDCIEMRYDEEGILYPQIDDGLCIECGKCSKACPSLNPVYDKSSEPECYAAYTDDPVRMESSSGGIFSLLADDVLRDGGAVCGAAFDSDWRLVQTFAYTPDELAPLRKSKYVQSDSGFTYRETESLLKSGRRVLYVGCPCQIAGLNAYLGKEYDNLLTVDLLCHGGPSPVAFEKYLREVHGGKKIEYVGFRDKDYYGWSTEMTVKYADGEIYRSRRSEDLFYRSFLPCLSVRPHCQVCNFSRIPRQGDITLGDFWGVSNFDAAMTDGNGTSIVSVNSRKGADAYDEMRHRLSVNGDLPREYVLTHGQPYGRPFRNNPRRYRFLRLLRDVTFESALECSEKNVFDFAYVGLNFDSCGSVLSSYSIYKIMARFGYTVLVARRPKECDSIVTERKYRMIAFANRHFPTLSTHDSRAGYLRLNEVARGFVSAEPPRSFSRDFCKYEQGVLEYKDACGSDAVDPLFLLSRADYAELAGFASCEMPDSFVAFDGDSLSPEAKSRVISFCARRGMQAVDLSSDRDIEAWISLIMNAAYVVSGSHDSACMATVFQKPLALAGEGAPKERAMLAKLGVDAPIWNGTEELSNSAFAIRGNALAFAAAVERSRSALQNALPRFRNDEVYRPKPPARYRVILKKCRKKAGKLKRKVLSKLR